ncbi:MAG TPA: CAP domain-containing protein [Candidatus Saccharimonadales bacterium]|nr:CAP domain-containing protein [Candidatus Saccharimonadales bacterium]
MKTKTKKNKKQIKTVAQHVKSGVKLAVVPHKKNDFRPHLIRYYGIIAIVFVVIGLQLGYNGAKTGNVLGVESNITITSLLNQTNTYRQEVGVDKLKLNALLDKAAYMKAQDMFAKQYWAHDSPDGVPPWQWFSDVGYNYNEAGENLAKNFSTTNGVMTAWINSPTHKANIVNKDYQDVGFAVVSGELDKKPATLVVAFYGDPADTATAATANTGTSFSESSQSNQPDILTQFAIATQSVTPAVMWAILILLFTAAVSVVAHINRHKLSKKLRKSWYRHHAMYKAIGLLSFGLAIIFLYGGGQI